MASSRQGGGEEETKGKGDEASDEDMEALRRACMITGRTPDDLGDSTDHEFEEENADIDDLDLVRSIQERFPVPLAVLPPPVASTSGRFLSDSDDEDDFATLGAIQRRFAGYTSGALLTSNGKPSQRYATCSSESGNNDKALVVNDSLIGNDGFAKSYHYSYSADSNMCDEMKDCKSSLPQMPQKVSSFPESARKFVDAIKKNRSCQRLIRRKLIDIEAKIEENKQLSAHIKCLMDFQLSCKRKAGQVLGQHKEPQIKLISLRKERNLKNVKVKDKKIPAMYTGPEENSHVQNYKLVLNRYPVSVPRQRWSNTETENLVKGIKQQVQEMLLQKTIEQYSDFEGSSGNSNAFDAMLASIGDLEISPENMRSFLPHVDWDRLASMYIIGRTGTECEVRWLNSEDPLINHSPWTKQEDKKLLYIIQQRGIYNWIEIATLLHTNRTPSQCLVRFQRSLNAHIMKKEWSKDEDAQLRVVVEALGENDWQLVASHMEGRTGRQCSERWLKALHPSRARVGRWTVGEDKYLKVAVTIFGPKTWQKIAKFVPGRTQVQCRERWCNVLDPSLNLEAWTAEEDSKLKAAIAELGHCWSKVAALVLPRTDNQCRRRWKVLFRDEVPLAQAARKIQRGALLTNFVDRKAERPALGPDDFFVESDVHPILEGGNEGNGKAKRTRERKNPEGTKDHSRKSRSKKPIRDPNDTQKISATRDDDCEPDTTVEFPDSEVLNRPDDALPGTKKRKRTGKLRPGTKQHIEPTGSHEDLQRIDQLQHLVVDTIVTDNTSAINDVRSKKSRNKGLPKEAPGSGDYLREKTNFLPADEIEASSRQIDFIPSKKRGPKKQEANGVGLTKSSRRSWLQADNNQFISGNFDNQTEISRSTNPKGLLVNHSIQGNCDSVASRSPEEWLVPGISPVLSQMTRNFTEAGKVAPNEEQNGSIIIDPERDGTESFSPSNSNHSNGNLFGSCQRSHLGSENESSGNFPSYSQPVDMNGEFISSIF